MIRQFHEELRRTTGTVLLVDDGSAEARVRSRSLPGSPVRWSTSDDPPTLRQWGGVALLVRDRQSLRRVVTALPTLGTSTRVWCWIEDCGGWAPAPVLRPEWPRMQALTVRTAGAALASLEFAARAGVREVFIGVARGSSTQDKLWSGQPLLAATGGRGAQWAPASPATLTGESAAALLSEDRSVAPDALLLEDLDQIEGEAVPVHPVTGRAVRPVVVEEPIPWRRLAPGELGAGAPIPDLDVLSVPPIDERIINPIGFEREWSHGIARVEPSLRSPDAVTVQVPAGQRALDLCNGLTDTDVRAMRSLQGVELGWRGGHGPLAYARLVAALAMAGVPITTTVVPRWVTPLLDDDLRAELQAPADLSDRLGREERSVRLRRAALRGHSSIGWRRRLALTHQLPGPRDPRVSILLTTRRPDMVDFALRQAARQRHASGEVILCTHGFEADDRVRHALDDVPEWDLQVVHQPATVPFGAVLNHAAARATGDVLVKMDDDDWYGPEFVADLLLARTYSGAQIVGTPAEFIFLTPLWATVRRPDATERFMPIVAGGTIMVDRTTFAEVGGFRPVRRAVDASLLAAVREGGGSVFRAHGLGYLLRRQGGGHTWDPGLGYFLTRSRVAEQWHGFRPSAELCVTDAERPRRPGDVATESRGAAS